MLTTSSGGAPAAPPCADVPALLLLKGVIFISIWDYFSLSRRLQFFFPSCPSLALLRLGEERQGDQKAQGPSARLTQARARAHFPGEERGVREARAGVDERASVYLNGEGRDSGSLGPLLPRSQPAPRQSARAALICSRECAICI